MRIALISDIHGNEAALNAALADIERSNVDEIICLGDAIDPLPGSHRVFDILRERNIPLIRGNHEDYVIRAVETPNDPFIADPKFSPVRLVASTFSKAEIEFLKEAPLFLTRTDSNAGDLILCHASPWSNTLGWPSSVDPAISEKLLRSDCMNFVGGHWHIPKRRNWEGKNLVTAGSVGIPFTEKGVAEFLIADATSGEWDFLHRRVSYSWKITTDEYISSGWLELGLPISLLFLFEIGTGQRTLSLLFPWMHAHAIQPRTRGDWMRAVALYLNDTGRWDTLASLFPEAALMLTL
jgi:predicted phosphodiesterase